MARHIDGDDVSLEAAHADGPENVVERHPHGSEVRLVAPHADDVERARRHEGDGKRIAQTEFVARPGGGGRGPETGEPAADHHDVLRHGVPRKRRTARRDTEDSYRFGWK